MRLLALHFDKAELKARKDRIDAIVNGNMVGDAASEVDPGRGCCDCRDIDGGYGGDSGSDDIGELKGAVATGSQR